jgi:hypothetical protein
MSEYPDLAEADEPPEGSRVFLKPVPGARLADALGLFGELIVILGNPQEPIRGRGNR